VNLKRWRYLFAAFVLLVAAAAAPAQGAAPRRLLLVGDSITEGDDGDTAYRCDLWKALGGAVDFVGNQGDEGSCDDGSFDPDHDGRGGATTAQRTAEMVSSGSFALNYEAALVHMGTNDKNGIDFGWNQAHINAVIEPAFRDLIAKLRQSNPNVTIYLAQIIPCDLDANPTSGFLGCNVTHNGGNDNNGQPVEGMNQVWARIAGDSSTANSPIVLVDHRVGFNTSDLKADKVHPNANGRLKMANKWMQALEGQLGDDVLLVEPNGRWHIRIPGQADRTFWYGNPGDIPLFGDWNGDGRDTPGAWRPGPGGGYAYMTNSLPGNGQVGVADFDFFFGSPGDSVFAGDWNGDGIDTLGINRGGRIFLTDTNGSGGAPVPTHYDFWFGAAGDRAFGGDGDGNGRDSVFLYRAADGFVYYTNQTPAGPGAVAATAGNFFFGQASDRFVGGDWNADSIDTAGIFRPSSTTVYLSNSNPGGGAPAPTDEAYGWGSTGWWPVAGVWK
jgi:lysophospholipase L1-like esterase